MNRPFHGASRAAIVLALLMPALAQAGTIQGTVSDADHTRALQSAQLRIVELNRAAEAGRDGSYIFADVPAGTYTLEVRYVGADPSRRQVEVGETGTLVEDFALTGFDGQDVLVIGQLANQASALSRQKAADGVESVLTRDAIGQFPDQNVAESLRRLPGVNILNDQGEGRFVSVRGLDPELNASSLNGVRLPAPESDVRSVALDVISSDTIESIEIKKSLTPDMDADTIGASIEIKTTSAFDRRTNLYTATAEGSYNDYSGKLTPKLGADVAARLTDDFGVAASISYYKRQFETDNIESGGWKMSDDGIAFADEIEYRDYDVTRERLNASLSFDLRATDTTKLYLRGNFAQFDDHEYRRRTSLVFDEDPSSGDADNAYFSDEDGRIEVRRDLKDRFERQRIRTITFGGETNSGDWIANWSASWAKSSEKEDFSIDPMRFRARFDGDGVDVNMNYADNRVPLFSVPSGADLFNDPAEYEFNRIELTNLSDSQDEEYALKGDLGRAFAMDGGTFTVQAGVKSRWRTKSYDFNMTYYGDYDGDFTLADVLGTQTYRLTDIGPVASKTDPADFFLANSAGFEIDPYESALNSATSDYSVKEDILAGYLLGRWDSATLRVIGGVRIERTWNRLDGQEVSDDGENVFVTPLSYERSYTDWLPSLTLRFQPQPNLVARFAVSKSLVRPKLSKLAPRYTINEDQEAEFGNPDLKPYKAWNFDAGVEYYFARNGGVTLGAFYKTIDDFIVDAYYQDDTAPYNGVYQGIAFREAVIPQNGDKAEIFGIEASVSQALDFLPGLLSGFLVQANYTYTDAKGDVYDEDMNLRSIPLPAASRDTFNVVLGYEKGPVNLRLAGTYRGKYLDELGGDAQSDRYVDNHFQLDFSAKFRVSENVRLYAEWVNINNARYFAYQNFDNRKRLLQYEEYGSTFKFGAKVNF